MKALARLGIVAAAALIAGCAAILGIDDGTPRDGSALGDASNDLNATDAGDASLDAPDVDAGPPPMCDVDAAFAAPIAFSTLDSPTNDAHQRLTPNELTTVFQSQRDGGLGGYDVYTATRASIGDTWSGITPVAPVDSISADTDPSISANELTLYFVRGSQILRSTRTTTASAFGTPVAAPVINSAGSDFAPYLVEDGTSLYFSSTRNSDAGVSQLFVANPTADGGFTAPANVNGTALKTGDNRFAAVTADQLVLYFGSNRTGTGTQGGYDIWVATRASTSVAFGTPRVVAEISSTTDETPDWVSADRCRLYFSSNRGASYDLYVATKTPP